MDRVLLVEDSRVVLSMLRHRIETGLGLACDCAETLSAASTFLDAMSEPYVAAVVDINLPDAPRGEAVERVAALGTVPVVVFSASIDAELQKSMWAMRVADYVLKSGNADIGYIVSLVARLRKNRETEVLVVDDATTFRRHATQLLRTHQYTVHQAEDSESALCILEANPNIALALVDYTMPGMNGVDFVRTIRHTRAKEDLVIIGMSGAGDSRLDAQFLKYGANDFLQKPFSNEQFYCRVNQNMEVYDLVRKLRETSNKDFLTGLYNRRYLLETGKKIFQAAVRSNMNVTVAMVDIDHFKKVNDTYGHDAGDTVINHVAAVLKKRFRESDIVARLGGEEFCVLALNMDPDAAEPIFDELRGMIEGEVETHAGCVPVTASIGICIERGTSLETMISHADARLYDAKESGRNRVRA